MSEQEARYLVEDAAMEAALNGPLPPEAAMTPDEYAAAALLGSHEFIEAGCPIPESPAEPALALAA